MDHPLHHQSSFDQHQYQQQQQQQHHHHQQQQQQHQQQQHQQQNSQYYQQTQHMTLPMQSGSPHIGSPLMNRINHMHQQPHQHHQQNHYSAHQSASPSTHHHHQLQHHQQQVHHNSLQPQHPQQQQQQQYQQQIPNNPMMQHIPQPQGQYNPQQNLQQQYISQQYPQQQQQQQQQQYQSNYNRNTISSSTNATATPIIIGPRAKCDQVIYEAMAKACEIAVRGRCTDLADGNTHPHQQHQQHQHQQYAHPRPTVKRRSWNYGGNNSKHSNNTKSSTTSTSSTSSTSSRFNIEVDEVPAVRSTVQTTWRRAPHTPLRLDIYYEHDGCYDDHVGTADATASREGATDTEEDDDDGREVRPPPPPPPPPPPQRELLERWCIDYVPSSSSSSNYNNNNNNATNSNYSSPYSSPSSSPYSSRIMMTGGGSVISGGSHDNNNGKSSSSMSQLRQVCKRIVVLLRSLHCLTRMLPSYRLKCLLLSNIANTYGVGGGGGVAHVNNGLVGGMATATAGVFENGIDSIGGSSSGRATAAAAAVGWGSIGFSIHVGSDCNERSEPALPSPSFARQSFPNVSTPYGNLRLSVMYDATLNPNHMMADLIERRSEWIQRRWAATATAGGGEKMQNQLPQYQQQQQQQQLQYLPRMIFAEQPSMGSVVPTPSSTQPILIAQGGHHQHHIGNNASGAPTTVASMPNYNQQLDKPKSCPSAVTLVGGPASFGSVGCRSRAVSDFIISDYHNSPKLKSLSHSPSTNVAGGETQRVMSGLSLAMMNNDADGNFGSSPGQDMVNQPNISPQQHTVHQYALSASPTGYGQYLQQQQETDVGLPSFGSPATRAAFHNPPPALYNPDIDIQQAISSGNEDHNYNGGGTHFFQKHGGYGYGYNGSNVQFGELESPPPPPTMNTPPTPQRGMFPSRDGSMSPSLARNDSGGNGSYGIDAPQFVNRVTLKPRPSPSRHRGGTPPTKSYLNPSGHHDPNCSPLGSSKGGVAMDGKSSDNSQQQRSRQRTSSSHQSAQLLPPVTSLDILQKSPFLTMTAAMRKTVTNASTGGEEGDTNNPQSDGPFILGSYGDDTLPSSIPQMVSNERNDSIAVSTLGGGGGSSNSNNQLMPPLGELSSSAMAGGSNPTIDSNANGNNSAHDNHRTAAVQQTEELPFAVDDINPLVSEACASSSIPSKSSSRSLLWGSTKADVLEGTIGGIGGGGDGDGGGGIAEITSTLAVSSLHHRCAADGKVRLKMFESMRTVESARTGSGGEQDSTTSANSSGGGGGDPTLDFDSIKGQLSEFRSFGASLMVGSTTRDIQTD